MELVKRLDERGKTDHRQPYDVSTQTIVKRLEMHKKKTLPVLGYYKKSVKTYHVNGEGSVYEVWEKVYPPAHETYRTVR